MRAPPVRFTEVGGEHVAYQVVGDSDRWGMALTSWLAAIDAQWEDPEHLRIWRTCRAAGARVIHLDHRGVGASDPVPLDRLADLDDWVDDVVAVLDAEGIDQVPMMAEAEQVPVAIRLAARFPDRVERLVLPHPWLRPPWPPEMVELIRQRWGTGEVLQSMGWNGGLDFLGRTERLSASRGVASRLLPAIQRWDVRADIPKVQAECLVLSVVGAPQPQQGIELAEALPNAELVEVRPTGRYWGDRMFERILEFFGFEAATGERRLATLVLTDVVGSTEQLAVDGDRDWRRTLDFLDELVSDRAERCGGTVLKHTGDGHLLSFDRPGDAVDAARSIADGAARLGVAVRSGVHTGEIELRDNHEVAGITVHAVARIAGRADGGQVLVSRTVADLVAGTGRQLVDRGDHELKGLPGEWRLLEAVDA